MSTNGTPESEAGHKKSRSFGARLIITAVATLAAFTFGYRLLGPAVSHRAGPRVSALNDASEPVRILPTPIRAAPLNLPPPTPKPPVRAPGDNGASANAPGQPAQPSVTPIQSPPVVNGPTSDETTVTYRLQFGAFQDQQSADALAQRVAGLKYTVSVRRVTTGGATMFVVQSEPFPSREDAETAAASFTDTGLEPSIVPTQ